MIVKFLLQLGFAGDFKACFDFGFFLIQIFQIFQLLWLIVAWFQSASPSMRIVESFSDDMDFVDRSGWRRPRKKPPDKFCFLNLCFRSRSTPKKPTDESHYLNRCSDSASFQLIVVCFPFSFKSSLNLSKFKIPIHSFKTFDRLYFIRLVVAKRSLRASHLIPC